MIVPFLPYLLIAILGVFLVWLGASKYAARDLAAGLHALKKLKKIEVCKKEKGSRIIEPFDAMDGLPICTEPPQVIVEYFVTYGYWHGECWRLVSKKPVDKAYFESVVEGQEVDNPFYVGSEA